MRVMASARSRKPPEQPAIRTARLRSVEGDILTRFEVRVGDMNLSNVLKVQLNDGSDSDGVWKLYVDGRSLEVGFKLRSEVSHRNRSSGHCPMRRRVHTSGSILDCPETSKRVIVHGGSADKAILCSAKSGAASSESRNRGDVGEACELHCAEAKQSMVGLSKLAIDFGKDSVCLCFRLCSLVCSRLEECAQCVLD
jgi:hypothetical protein